MTRRSRPQPHLPDVLRLADERRPVPEIAVETGLSESRVYGILREHRPDRKRTPRRATSSIPAKIAVLAAAGTEPKRVMKLLGISKAYVYRWWPVKEQDA